MANFAIMGFGIVGSLALYALLRKSGVTQKLQERRL